MSRPTEADEHWTVRQRLRKARREEVARLYRDRVEPRLASGCHVPGRSVGPCPTVAHNSSYEAINYCGQVLEGSRPVIERLVRGDFYTAGPGGNVGDAPGTRVQGKSFRCRAEQPEPAEEPETPTFLEGVRPGSVRSACGGRHIAKAKQRNMNRGRDDVPLKPLVDPVQAHAGFTTSGRPGSATRRAASAGGRATATTATTKSRSGAPWLDDRALEAPNCELAEEESKGLRQPHHCYHRHREHHHGEPKYAVDNAAAARDAEHVYAFANDDDDASPRRDAAIEASADYADAAVDASVDRSDAGVQATPLANKRPIPKLRGVASRGSTPRGNRPASADGRRPAFMQNTAASKAKETKVIVERPSSAGYAAEGPESSRPAKRVDPYETALRSAKEHPPGSAALMSRGELERAVALANKPPTPRPQQQTRRPKDTSDFLR